MLKAKLILLAVVAGLVLAAAASAAGLDVIRGTDGPDILNGTLSNLTSATLTSIQRVGVHHTCAILHLELGPLNLTLLGLNIVLDNCANGPVTVDITAITGRGNLLGNLLCELLGGNLINLGATLQDILNQILRLLNQ